MGLFTDGPMVAEIILSEEVWIGLQLGGNNGHLLTCLT